MEGIERGAPEGGWGSGRAWLEGGARTGLTFGSGAMQAVLRLYEKHKGNPPTIRNAPPVTGNILWAKQLLNRIEVTVRTELVGEGGC